MDLFLSCERGCAPFVHQELALRKLLGSSTSVEEFDNCLVVRGLSEEQVVLAAYTLQTPLFVGELLGGTSVSVGFEDTIVELSALAGTIPLEGLFEKDKTFTVSCTRNGSHEYTSVDVSSELGRLLKQVVRESLGFVPVVDMKKPFLVIHVHIEEESSWVARDLLGRNPAKRSYKVFNNPHSMKGPVAACLLMAAGWKPGMSVLDPFTADGVLPIEAALMSTYTSLHFFDKNLALWKGAPRQAVIRDFDALRLEQGAKFIVGYDAQLRNVTAAKKNAKIAGVEKSLTLSRLEVEWVDTKLSSGSVDRLVCRPVEQSKHVVASKASAVHKDLFYQADYALSKDGSLTFFCHRPQDLVEVASQKGFVVVSERLVHTGQLPVWIVSFVRKV